MLSYCKMLPLGEPGYRVNMVSVLFQLQVSQQLSRGKKFQRNDLWIFICLLNFIFLLDNVFYYLYYKKYKKLYIFIILHSVSFKNIYYIFYYLYYILLKIYKNFLFIFIYYSTFILIKKKKASFKLGTLLRFRGIQIYKNINTYSDFPDSSDLPFDQSSSLFSYI